MTTKSFLKKCIFLANQTTFDLKGNDKLTEDEKRSISDLSVVLQNELG